ncbi:hypothetical protein LTR84_009097 [Exophiala bonariae]|uniref:Carboxylic ester hydrolase n=1 Tax=Exophiala bonariae TaxID=1690606 RepID=A0AAV9MVS3_9EURO|nr:hypothetical protein LTR84_009097 [Exophiala bonariae]
MDDGTTVQTSCGILQGQVEGQVRVFRGVPFACPPIGERRFKSPTPFQWTGVRKATCAGPAAPQANSKNMDRIRQLICSLDREGVPGIIAGPPYVFNTYDHDDISEDCLYLDLWAPLKTQSRKKYPVYLYYHGGANIVSSGSFLPERGHNLACQEDIIVVRPNYRLGALGWVHFGLISNSVKDAINLGIQDQIAALKWTHVNIEAFGGDPDNITVGGESAGGTAVSHLLVNPDAQKLVRRAIAQSLSPFNVWATQQSPEAAVVARKYLDMLQIEDPAQLMEVDVEKLLAVHNILLRLFPADANLAWCPSGGVVDGLIVPENPALCLSVKPYPRKDFELMVGFAKDEWQFFRGHSPTLMAGTRSDVLAVLAQVFGDEQAEALLDSYQEMHVDHDHRQLLNDIMSMEFFKLSSICIGLNLADQGIPTYLFQFAIDLPRAGGAIHTGDMPFIWRNFTTRDLQRWPAFEGFDVELFPPVSASFGSMYGSFIRNGTPGNHEDWPPFEGRFETILSFGTHLEARPGLLQGECKAFKMAGISGFPALHERLLLNVQRGIRERITGSLPREVVTK